MSSEAEKVVCVTGASGFIASWLVKLLLQRGYTVRDPNDPKRAQHLLALDGAKERLHLFKAELLDEGSFDSVVEGCIGVFHTASPVYLDVKDPEVEMIGPAVKGTLNVLRSCAKFPSIRRVVLTSSTAAVVFSGKPLADGDIVDETWFSDRIPLIQWYMLSKTLAEKAAWKLAQENNIDMVTLNPVLVIGPLLQPTLNLSVKVLQNLIEAKTYPNSTSRWVDVRDVANAHILALENPSAAGRYCLALKPVHNSQLLKILRELYPTLSLPEKCVEGSQSLPAYQISQERAKSLGVNFTPLEVSLKDKIESLKEKKFLSF